MAVQTMERDPMKKEQIVDEKHQKISRVADLPTIIFASVFLTFITITLIH